MVERRRQLNAAARHVIVNGCVGDFLSYPQHLRRLLYGVAVGAHAAGPNSVLRLGTTAVHLAALRDYPAVIRHLAEKRVNLNVTDKEGLTPLDYAQGRAEDLARSRDAGALVSPDAPWRQRPASPKQRAVLTQRRISFDAATLTAGAASDLMTATFAARNLRRRA